MERPWPLSPLPQTIGDQETSPAGRELQNAWPELAHEGERCVYDARSVLAALVAAVLVWFPASVAAQDVEELFRKVNPSVVVIRATGAT